jgi:hypothetical protein
MDTIYLPNHRCHYAQLIAVEGGGVGPSVPNFAQIGQETWTLREEIYL